VTIDADHAALTMAYWYTGERARKTIREALGYLAVVERETGWTTFDPQIGRRLDLWGDFNEVVSAYEGGSGDPRLYRDRHAPGRVEQPAAGFDTTLIHVETALTWALTECES
jgi:hypothetical protein